MEKQFTLLEKEIILLLYKEYPFLSGFLTEDKISKHEYSGVGFFIDFQNTGSFKTQIGSPLEGPYIYSNELETFGQALVFHKDGKDLMLEIYSCETEFPLKLKNFKLKFESKAKKY